MTTKFRKAIQYVATVGLVLTVGLVPLAATVSNYSVTPGTITFTSSNPDGTTTGAPATTTVSFKTTANPTSFHLYAKAAGTNFTCTNGNTPPINSVTMSCSSASGVTCVSGNVTLTNTGNGTVVATGSMNHNPASFVITYTFQDGWKYSVGSTCSLSVSHIYMEP